MALSGRHRRLAVAAAAACLPLLAAAQGGPQPAADPVRDLTVLLPEAGHVAWAPRGDWIAYDKVDFDGYSRLWVARPDGRERRCLTCEPLEFRKRHTGNPAWHPSGRYLVVEVAKPFKRAGRPEPFLLVPGRNLGNELWAVRFEDRGSYQLTSHGERGSGWRVHSPRFSREGDRLAWAERVAAGEDWGQWELRVAEIGDRRGVPRLRKTRAHRLGRDHRFLEPYGFTADDRGLLIAAERAPGGPEEGLDLFLLDLDSGAAERLTGGAARHNRFASMAPNGRWVAWASDREMTGRRPGAPVALDLWMMRVDGREPRRLTRFGDVFAETYSGPVTVRSPTWSPEGDRLLFLAAAPDEVTSGSVYLLVMDRAYGR